jgi:S-adenosylmethionine:tRNA ribosyltransferase-isomerase
MMKIKTIMKSRRKKISSKTNSYDFTLPSELIASYPASPRESSKLLIYNRIDNSIKEDIFKNIEKYLPKDITIFLNNTKVFKAKFYAKKQTGGKVEILINKSLGNNKYNIFIKGKVKEKTILYIDNIKIEVLKLLNDGTREAVFFINENPLYFNDLIQKLDKLGEIPLPPYMNKKANKNDEISYQSVFAKEIGSVAAPTASFHFSDTLFKKIKANYDCRYLTLHIGAGTFKPVNSKDITNHIMHSEYYEINKKDIEIINSNKKILCIGTTSTRTIEYYARTKIRKGECDLFLNPLNKPQRVDYLLSNFHLPKSTLIMLISSFIGREKTLELYDFAIKNKYRFFSYGDCMLIL